MGATSPARWQRTQLLYRMGATSFVKVGAAAVSAALASPEPANRNPRPKRKMPRFIRVLPFVPRAPRWSRNPAEQLSARDRMGHCESRGPETSRDSLRSKQLIHGAVAQRHDEHV